MTPPAAERPVTALVVTVVVGYALLTYAAIAPGLNLAGALLGLVLTVGVVVVQLGQVSRPGARHSREGTALALLALACLVYVPVVALSVGWIAFAGFLAGSVLVLLPPRAALAGATVVVVSVGLLVRVLGGAPVLAVVTTMVGTAVTALVIQGLTRLWALTTPGIVASEVAGPGEAEPELAEPGEAAAGEPAGSALAEELAAARTALAPPGIELSVLGGDTHLPEEVATLFAGLLRVAVGHAARHTDATSCHVTVVRRGTEARIVVTHDGATDDPDPDDFEALGERFDAADGSVLAERDDEQFTVDGRLPLPA